MKTFNYNITKDNILTSIDEVDYNFIQNNQEVLIQVFSGETYQRTKEVLSEIQETFPHAKVITSSTDGEIVNNIVSTRNIIISISVFQKTQVSTAYSFIPSVKDAQDNCFVNGVEIAKKLVKEKTKLLILFIGGINANGEKFLDGVYSVSPNIIVSGGLSGDNGNFIECFVGLDKELHKNGVVGVALDSDDLIVKNLYSFGWDKVGIEHTITKSKNNCVYEIDNIKALDFYKKYLGEESANNLPAIGMEFPLIYEKDGISIARAMTADNKDGSLNFAGNIAENTKVYLGIGNIDKIITNHINNLSSFSHETFFIYSCMARRRFIPNDIYRELTQFINLAPTSGFFTYGEFFTSKKYELLNHTLTAVSLSENLTNSTYNATKYIDRRNNDAHSNTIGTLTNILNQTYKDLEEKNQALNKSVDHFKVLFDTALEGIIIADKNFDIIDINDAALNIFHYKNKEEVIYKKNLIDYIPPDQFEKVKKGLQQERVEPYEANLYTRDKVTLPVLVGGKTVIRNNEQLRITTIIDLSQIKLKDQQLIQQSHLAQMGEMINMIAHQWRQPLNTINIIATKIKMKTQLDMLDKHELIENTNSIEKITKNMSQTIEDFMNLTNPNLNKEEIVFAELFEEIYNILGAQFKAHDIELKLINNSNISIFIQKNDLIHILINILTNARDALNDSKQLHKEISITVSETEDEVSIIISDNGDGVEEKNISRIFEPYFTTKEQGQGTGLGLYMSKKILKEILNGDISVKNNVTGADFTIVLYKNTKKGSK